MKVKELISKLQELDGELNVTVYDWSEEYSSNLTKFGMYDKELYPLEFFNDEEFNKIKKIGYGDV